MLDRLIGLNQARLGTTSKPKGKTRVMNGETHRRGIQGSRIRARSATRRLQILGFASAAVLFASAALAGCGGSQDSSTPPEEVGGPLSNVGSITASGKGTTLKNAFRLGPLLYSDEGTPPKAVLSACIVRGSAAITNSAFARGEVDVTHQKGTRPASLNLTTELVKANGGQATLAALEIDGKWHCAIEELINVVLKFQPGESRTFPLWVVAPGVLGNEQPPLPLDVLNTWYFDSLGRIGNQTELTVRGPGKGRCNDGDAAEWRLFLYNRSGKC